MEGSGIGEVEVGVVAHMRAERRAEGLARERFVWHLCQVSRFSSLAKQMRMVSKLSLDLIRFATLVVCGLDERL